MELDLTYLRQHAGLTQQEIADKLSVSKATVSNWESNPQNVTFEKLTDYLSVLGLSLNDLGEKRMINAINIDGNPELLSLQKKIQLTLQQVQLNKANTGVNSKPYFEQAYAATLSDLQRLQMLSRKPRVLIVGPSDSGKSTFINNLLQQDVVPTHWTPATGMTIKIVHASEKPEWLLGNTILVKEDLEKDGASPETWDLRNREYYDDHVAESGDRSLISSFGERDGDNFNSEKALNYVIFTYIDAPLLNTVEIWDTPGTNAGEDEISQRDEQISLASRSNADAVLYFMQAGSFMSGQNFSLLRADIERLPQTYDNNGDLGVLSNLFVVASQADVMESKDVIDDVLSRNATRFYNSIPDGKIGEHQFTRDELASRFFSLSNKREDYSDNLLAALTKFFENIQYITLANVKNLIQEVSDSRNEDFNQIFDKISTDRDQHDELTAVAAEKHANLPDILTANSQFESDLLDKVKTSRQESTLEFMKEYQNFVSVDNIVSLLDEGDYQNKKESKEVFISYFSNKLGELYKRIVDKHTAEFSDSVYDALKDAQAKASVSANMFDYKAAVAGLVASGITIGAFAAFAATITSNLGLYILVAQIGGLLTSAGIISSPVVAVAGVSALGGPVVWVIGIALILGILVAGIVSRGAWKKAFAKHIAKSLEEQHVEMQYVEALGNVWRDTETGVHKIKEGLDLIAKKDVEIAFEKANSSTEDFDSAIEQVQSLQRVFNQALGSSNLMIE